MHTLFFQNLLPGTVLFSRFELLECISAGDNGGVYRCKELANPNQLVALKIFSTQAFQRDPQHRNLQDEIQLAFSIKHPHVVHCLDFFSDESFTAFSMEYVEGGTLADYVEERGILAPSEIARLLRQLASGIAAIHSFGIVHRDLKPENILVDQDLNLKVTDFGIASCDCSSDSDVEGEIRGTVNYLSPEYIARGEYDARTDIYAFGVVAYELMTGRLPFTGAGILDTLISRVRFDPVHPRMLRPDLPRALGDLAVKAMQRDPARRFQSIAEIVSNLDLIEGLDANVGVVRRDAFERLLPVLSNDRRTARAA